MSMPTELESFLSRNNIEPQEWEAANIDWKLLEEIREHYIGLRRDLEDIAELKARAIQRIGKVHSVRWRIKDTEHLLVKIVRKKANQDSSEKYASIGVDNYFKIIQDLVGVRALHLFKEDCFEIHSKLKNWETLETPTAYIRDGDSPDQKTRLEDAGLTVKTHSAGYRSIHYIAPVSLTGTPITTTIEIQVRTIFEEGWSEIDHQVRYPNFSDNPLISYFLNIFNQASGMADEMGNFVLQLADVEKREAEIRRKHAEEIHARDSRIDQAFTQLDNSEAKSAEAQVSLQSLKNEIAKLKEENHRYGKLEALEPSAGRSSASVASDSISTWLNSDSKVSEAVKLGRLHAAQQNSLMTELHKNLGSVLVADVLRDIALQEQSKIHKAERHKKLGSISAADHLRDIELQEQSKIHMAEWNKKFGSVSAADHLRDIELQEQKKCTFAKETLLSSKDNKSKNK